MGGKRSKAESEETPLAVADDENPNNKKRKILPSLIKNKEKRSAVHAKLKHDKKIEKKKKAKLRDAAHKRALELGEEVLNLLLLLLLPLPPLSLSLSLPLISLNFLSCLY